MLKPRCHWQRARPSVAPNWLSSYCNLKVSPVQSLVTTLLPAYDRHSLLSISNHGPTAKQLLECPFNRHSTLRLVVVKRGPHFSDSRMAGDTKKMDLKSASSCLLSSTFVLIVSSFPHFFSHPFPFHRSSVLLLRPVYLYRTTQSWMSFQRIGRWWPTESQARRLMWMT